MTTIDTNTLGLSSLAPPAMPTSLSGPAALTGSDEQRAFRDVLGISRLKRTEHAGPDATPEQRARVEEARARETREAAEALVAKTFIEPILAQMRESTDAAPPFAPTQAEKQFRALADAQLAQSVVERAHLPIVDRLARDLLAYG